MENVTYRVERSACGGFVNCYYGRETIDVYSIPLKRVAWWELLPWQECPPFETGNKDLGCYVLACSILAHHFQETPAEVAKNAVKRSCTRCAGAATIMVQRTSYGGTIDPCPDCENGIATVPCQTHGRFVGFAVEIVRTQQLKPGEFYIITTEVINEWLETKAAETAPRITASPAS